MSTLTSDPWKVGPSLNEIVNLDHGRLPFAITKGLTLIGALYENDSNARLIEAAPVLLGFAEEVVLAWDHRDEEDTVSIVRFHSAIEALAAVVAIAKGGAA